MTDPSHIRGPGSSGPDLRAGEHAPWRGHGVAVVEAARVGGRLEQQPASLGCIVVARVMSGLGTEKMALWAGLDLVRGGVRKRDRPGSVIAWA